MNKYSGFLFQLGTDWVQVSAYINEHPMDITAAFLKETNAVQGYHHQ